MVSNFWQMVNKVIHQADILLEVVDARMITETRNLEIEERIHKLDKKLILVVNKADLVGLEILKKKKAQLRKEGMDCIFLSARKHLGNTILKRRIMRFAEGDTRIGVLGYPNTGKSSVINVLKGVSASHPTSCSSILLVSIPSGNWKSPSSPSSPHAPLNR